MDPAYPAMESMCEWEGCIGAGSATRRRRESPRCRQICAVPRISFVAAGIQSAYVSLSRLAGWLAGWLAVVLAVLPKLWAASCAGCTVPIPTLDTYSVDAWATRAGLTAGSDLTWPRPGATTRRLVLLKVALPYLPSRGH